MEIYRILIGKQRKISLSIRDSDFNLKHAGFLSLCSVLIFEIFLIPFLLEGGAKCLLGQKRGQRMMELDKVSMNPLELWHSLGY